jgi:hypothetical protein
MTSCGFLLIFREKDVMTYQSLNLATGELLKKFDELTDKELETRSPLCPISIKGRHEGLRGS